MDYYQRDIKIKLKTIDVNSLSGRTEYGDHVDLIGTSTTLIPDDSISYNIKIYLKSDFIDLGIMESVDVEDNDSETFDVDEYIITGTCDSRLYELEKYGFNNNINEKYKMGGTINIDGVSLIETDKITYYINGIKYVDHILDEKITYYSFLSTQYDDNFINNYYVKLPHMENYNEFRIENNVNIERQNISAFDGNNRLEFLNNLVQLTTYGGGKVFNIENNK